MEVVSEKRESDKDEDTINPSKRRKVCVEQFTEWDAEDEQGNVYESHEKDTY